jgi:hypothetical protein
MVIHLWILVQLNRWTRGNRSVRYESNRNSEMGQESWRTEVSLNATMLWIRSHGQAHTSSEVIGVSIEYDRPQLWPPGMKLTRPESECTVDDGSVKLTLQPKFIIKSSKLKDEALLRQFSSTSEGLLFYLFHSECAVRVFGQQRWP